MSRFIIHGQRRLCGAFRPAGNKNAVLPMLAAAVLTDESIELHNVPLIEDVRSMLGILEKLGVEIAVNDRTVRLCAKGLRRRKLDRTLCHQVRSSILFAGPMVARHRRAIVYPPGGDVIGRRRLDTHLLGLRALGVEMHAGDHFTFRSAGRLRGARILLDEASVTGTENIMMAACLAEGITTIFNAACEPHVQDLGRLLVKMGARIAGLGTNFLTIEGMETLRGATHTIAGDHIEIGSFLAAAAVTGGEIAIAADNENHIAPLFHPFRALGLNPQLEGDTLRLSQRRPPRIRNDFGQAMPKIEDGPWPAFPSDLMSVAIVAATQARGTILFFEKMFESRMYFTDRLINMGARIVPCDPHRVVVVGPSRLHAVPVSSPDIRAGMAMLIAALCARGQTVIHNAEVIDRGYENVEERLRALGAEIERD